MNFKKALWIVFFALLALVVTTVVAVVLVVRLALAPGPGEWPARVPLGPIDIEVGVPTALRLATSSWAGPLLAGRSLDTTHGRVDFGFDESTQTLELRCAPCRAVLPALGDEALSVDSLRMTARRDGANLSGQIEAAPAARTPAVGSEPLRARWSGRLTQQQLRLQIDAPEAPVTRWLATFAPALPELQRARIDGTLALRADVLLPEGRVLPQPRLSGFAVQGLGTEAMLGARTQCGPSARLAADSPVARAVLAAEDQRFYQHPGFDLIEMLASLEGNQKAGQVERGGSTLTQQLARLLVTGSERSLQRKLQELLYAVEMEDTLGKPRILQLYLDNAPWGLGLCGAEAASRRYFKRSARQLDTAQAVWLASMLNNPDAAVERWRRDGRPDAARMQTIAEGLRGSSRAQKDALLKSLAGATYAAP